MIDTNPFCPDNANSETCVFVPRETAYNRIHQYLSDPTSAHAFVLSGGNRVGKTTLLCHFSSVFPSDQIGVYIPLAEINDTHMSEEAFLRLCARSIQQTLNQQQIIESDIPEDESLEADATRTRNWFKDEFLSQVFVSMRNRKRLVLLIDDAERLIGTTDTNLYTILSESLTAHQQLSLILAVNNTVEADIQQFASLVSLDKIHRLNYFTFAETQSFLHQAAHIFTTDDAGMEMIHRASGGNPVILQHFGHTLYDYAMQSHVTPQHISSEQVRSLLPQVADRTAKIYHNQWQQLTLDEQLVLTALSSLVYNNPLEPIQSESIETWLIRTDYPLDITAIKVAIRSLQYDLIVNRKETGVEISSGLVKTWLLTHAQLDGVPSPQIKPEPTSRRQWIIVVAVVVLLLAALGYSRQISREPVTPPVEIPTVTLNSP